MLKEYNTRFRQSTLKHRLKRIRKVVSETIKTLGRNLLSVVMRQVGRRPAGLVLIVVYKTLVALLMGATAIILFLMLEDYQAVVDLSESYVLEGKLELIGWILEQITALQPSTLLFSGIAAGIYAIVSVIEAIGLWYDETWAKLLVAGLVGISIPLEIVELFQGATLVKWLVFSINVAVFSYLLREFL